jgi:hypothetical protein
MLNEADIPATAGHGSADGNSIRKPMLYPLSYEGLRCTFAQDAGQVSVRWARAGYLRPNGLCRTCAACREASFRAPPDTRG